MSRAARPITSATKGLLLALLGFSMLSVGDGIVKSMAGMWPATAISAVRYAIGLAGLAAIVGWREGRRGLRVTRPGLQLARAAAISVATVAFFSSIFLMPLADATAIHFISPMLTVLMSALFLGERTSRGALVAIGIAFAGVLIVLRPNLFEIGAAALVPLVAATGMATLMILNRRAAGLSSALASQYQLALFALPILLAVVAAGHLSGAPALHVGVPHWSVLARCGIVAVTASFAHWALYRATEYASAAAIAPMSYAQLIVAIAIGAAAFGDLPDATTLIGGALVIGAGLWLFRQQGAPAGKRVPVEGTPD